MSLRLLTLHVPDVAECDCSAMHWRVPMSYRVRLSFALALLVGVPVLAVSTKFSNFTPLISSATGLPIDGPEEASPVMLSNAQ